MEMPTVPSSSLHSGFMVSVSAGGFSVFSWCSCSCMFFCCFSDVLASTSERDAPLQHHIHALCEAWWKKDLKEKEKFGRTAFLVSLKKSLTSKKPVSLINVGCKISQYSGICSIKVVYPLSLFFFVSGD